MEDNILKTNPCQDYFARNVDGAIDQKCKMSSFHSIKVNGFQPDIFLLTSEQISRISLFPAEGAVD